MTILDSSCWIEHFQGRPRARLYAPLIADRAGLLLPSICLCEIERWLLRESSGSVLRHNQRIVRGTRIVDLTSELASRAAEAGLRLKLPLADSIIYATAMQHAAELWTQDGHFKGLPGVRYFA